MMKVTFNKEKIRAFTKPLSALTSVVTDEDGGIIINFDKEKKDGLIAVKKDSYGMIIIIKYKPELFENMDIDNNEKVGILKLGDFIKYFSIIDDDATEVVFKDNTFTITSNESDFSFKIADTDMIKEGLKNFKGAAVLTEMDVDAKFDRLKKAMGVLSTEDCVYIKGSSADSNVAFTVKNSNMEINKFNIKIPATVSSDFDSPYNKELLSLAFGLPTDTLKLSVAERFISFVGESKYYTMSYFIAKKTLK